MWPSLKRLALGFFLLSLTSSLLLMADWHRRKPAGGDVPTTATVKTPGGVTKQWQLHLVEYTNVSDVEEAEHGVLAGFKDSGLVEGRDYAVTIRNAQGDMGTVGSLIDASLSEGADMLITLSTPTLQAAVQRVQKIPVVFTFVSVRIMRGENPATIPFQLMKKTTLVVNLEAARQLNVVLPPALIQQAGKVIGQ